MVAMEWCVYHVTCARFNNISPNILILFEICLRIVCKKM